MTPDDDLEDARWQIGNTMDGLAAATRLEVHLGEAHRTYPAADADDEPLAVIADPAVIADVLRVLRAADPFRRVVAHALAGLSLAFFARTDDDDDAHLGSVHMLSPDWIRGWWSYDARLPSPVLADIVASLERAPWDPRAEAAIDAALAGVVGADAYPATADHRDELAAAHPDWLPLTDSGL